MAEQETSYALSDLVKRRRAELGLSLRKLEERCVYKGEQRWTRSTIENLEKRRSTLAPKLPDLQALADALELPLRQLQDAAGAQFLGISTADPYGDGRVRVLAHRASVISGDDLERLIAIADTFPVDPDAAGKKPK